MSFPSSLANLIFIHVLLRRHDGQVVERLTYPSKHNKVFADYFQMNIFPMQVIFSIGTLVFLMNKWRIRRKRHIGRHKKCDAHSDSCVVV